MCNQCATDVQPMFNQFSASVMSSYSALAFVGHQDINQVLFIYFLVNTIDICLKSVVQL
jgi:hypothetical protein